MLTEAQKAAFVTQAETLGQKKAFRHSPVYLLASILAINSRLAAIETALQADPANPVLKPIAPTPAEILAQAQTAANAAIAQKQIDAQNAAAAAAAAAADTAALNAQAQIKTTEEASPLG